MTASIPATRMVVNCREVSQMYQILETYKDLLIPEFKHGKVTVPSQDMGYSILESDTEKLRLAYVNFDAVIRYLDIQAPSYTVLKDWLTTQAQHPIVGQAIALVDLIVLTNDVLLPLKIPAQYTEHIQTVRIPEHKRLQLKYFIQFVDIHFKMSLQKEGYVFE